MERTNTRLQLLLEEVTGMYNAEKEIALILPILFSSSADDFLNEGIAREAEENKRQCARLEGIMTALARVCARRDKDENLCNAFSVMVKRVSMKHARFGYHNTIFMAEARGELAIARQLRKVFLPRNNALNKELILSGD